MEDHELQAIIQQNYEEIARENEGVLGNPTGKPSYAYIRVSSSGQAEEGRSGLPRQLPNIHEKAKELNLRIPLELVYSDDHTGFEFRGRPGLDRLLQEMKQADRRAHHIVMEYIDRLSRNARWHQGYLLDLFAEHQLATHFWKPFGSEIERAVMGAISEQGMRDEIERMVRGTRHKAQSGRITAKRPAYGYMFVDSEGRPGSDPASNYRKDTRYAPHPDEAPIVREIYHLIGVEGKSLFAVCDYLNRNEVPPPKNARYWESGNLSKMIKNPLYKGEFIANRYYKTKEWSERTLKMVIRERRRPKDQWIIVPVPPLVSPELWEATQEALKRNMKISTRKAKESYLLQAFLRCARCGYGFVVGGATGPIVDGRRTKFYYTCKSWLLQPVLREKLCCGSPYIFRDFIDPHVWDSICQVITNPDILIGYLEEQSQRVVKEGLNDQLAYIDRQIASCDREETQWDRAYAAEIFSLDEYKDKKATLFARERALEEERQKLLQEIAEARKFEGKKQAIRQQLEFIRQAGFAHDIPFKDKRRIMAMLIDQVTIDTVEKWYRLEGVITGKYEYAEEADFACMSDL